MASASDALVANHQDKSTNQNVGNHDDDDAVIGDGVTQLTQGENQTHPNSSSGDMEQELQHVDKKCLTLSKRVKVVQTVVLYFGFFILGVGGAIVGPSLLDLQITSGATSDTITYIFIARAVGGMAGAILSGLVIGRINPWLLLAGSTLLCGGMVTAMPWCNPMASLMAVMCVGGMSSGFFDAGGNIALLGIWGEEHGPWMQALHCIFGLGTWFAPLLVQPFLADNDAVKTEDEETGCLVKSNAREDGSSHVNGATPPSVVYQSQTGLLILGTSNQTVATTMSTLNVTSRDNKSDNYGDLPQQTNIAYAYLIVGMLCLVVVVSMLVICWSTTDRKIEHPKGKAKRKEKGSKKKPHDLSFRIQLITLVFMFYLVYCILELNYGNYLLIYAVKHLCWPKKDAASVTSAYYGAFTAARALGIILVKYFRPQVLMTLDVITTVIALIPLLFFAKSHVAVLWASTILFGMGMATTFALGITWTERYIKVTGPVGAVFMVAGAGGELVGPVVISLLFSFFGYQSFIYAVFSFSVLNLLIFACMQMLAWRRGERYAKDLPAEECINHEQDGTDDIASVCSRSDIYSPSTRHIPEMADVLHVPPDECVSSEA